MRGNFINFDKVLRVRPGRAEKRSAGRRKTRDIGGMRPAAPAFAALHLAFARLPAVANRLSHLASGAVGPAGGAGAAGAGAVGAGVDGAPGISGAPGGGP